MYMSCMLYVCSVLLCASHVLHVFVLCVVCMRCVFCMCVVFVVCVLCVLCVCGIVIMHSSCLSHENILRVKAIKHLEFDGHKRQRNSPVVIVQETIVLREPPLKALEYVLNFYADDDVYLIHFQTFLLSFY